MSNRFAIDRGVTRDIIIPLSQQKATSRDNTSTFQNIPNEDDDCDYNTFNTNPPPV